MTKKLDRTETSLPEEPNYLLRTCGASRREFGKRPSRKDREFYRQEDIRVKKEHKRKRCELRDYSDYYVTNPDHEIRWKIR